MEHKNPMSRVERLHREKVTRYSIRKYSFGAASVAVAALFMFLGNGAVSANELSKQDTPSVEASAPASENKTTSEEATAKPVEATTPTLDKSELTNLISEIETKLSNGSYDNKTEESVAVLKADLESAKATLANATTQAELKKAYSKLVTTANTKLKNKPVEKKETPAVDTTNGKETVGKKADNTEKKSESNSIENSGSKDERNGQALDKNNAFRAETTATQGNFTYSMEYSNGKEIYLYNEEDAAIDITVNSTAGDITKATVKSGSGQFLLKSKRDAVKAGTKPQPVEEENEIDGFGWTYRQTLTPTKGPVTIKITGKPNDEFKGLSAYKKTEDQNAVLGARYLQLENSNGDKLAAGSNLNAPGAFNLVVKSQTYKYDIQPVAEGDKVPVADINSLTAPEITKIKEKIKIQYSDTATTQDARLASHRGEVLADRSSVVKDVAVANGTVTVTYKDDSVDTTPVANVARVNAAPTVEIPYSVGGRKDVFVYSNEDFDIPIKFTDDSGKIASAEIVRGGNKVSPAKDASNPNILNNEYDTVVEKISTETPATADKPAVVHIRGKITKDTEGGTPVKKITLPTTESAELPVVTRYATATDTDGAYINNTATGSSYANDPGSFRIVLKAQTAKYDIKDPETKVTVANANNITEDEFNQIKNSIKIQYSTTNPDKNLLDKQGKDVENQTDRIESITREGNNVVVTYKDGSKDTKALADFVNVAPKVEVPYSNQTNKEIYVYSGENTDLTFKGSDENEVKDLYLRGPGDVKENNANKYGFTTGKVENGVVTGEGSVSEDKRTATIKMTGTTNLTAGKAWTSFIVSKDNDGKLSNTDYRALDVDKNAKEKPGYARFVVKNQTSKYDIAAPTEKVAVADPANVTADDLDKIKEKLQIEYSNNNDDANLADKKGKAVDAEDAKTKIKSVEKDNAGNLVVTYTDGSTDKKPLSDFVTLDKQPAIEAVEKAAEAQIAAINKTPNATDDEKQAAIDKVNADKTAALTAINDAATKTALDTAKDAGTTAIAGDNPVVAKKDAAKADVEAARKAKEDAIKANPNLTQAEKDAAIAKNNTAAAEATKAIDSATTNDVVDAAKTAGTGEIAKVNPVAKEAAKKAVADELKAKEAEIAGRNDLTDEEKAKAKEEAQAKAKEATDAIDAQPSNAETPEKAAEAQTAVDGAKDKGVADVKAVDPEAKAKPAAKKAIEDKLAKQLEDIANTPDATDDEKKVAADAAKALAEGAKKEIDKAGTDAEVKQLQEEAEGEIEKSVPVVEDKPNARKAIEDEAKAKKEAIDARTDLTPKAKEDLKAQVDAIADQAKKSVDAAKTSEAVDGIEESDKAAIKAVGEVNIPADKVLVNNPSALTDDEKAKVLEAVKKVNPDAKEITQDADGNVTVTTPDGHKEIITPEQVVKTAATANDPKAGNDIVKPADKVVVNDPAKLTDAEKEKIKAAVEAVNPNSIVVVDDKGNAKVSTPDGQTQVIPVEELVRTVEDTKKPNAGNDIVKPADKTVVANPEKLTDTEKKAIEDKVKAVNPDATVVVDDKGNVTVTTPEGKTAVIPATDLTKDPEAATKPNAGNDIVKPADKTAVKDPANLTKEEKKAIEDKVKAVNPGATVVVDDKGNATVTTPEGKTAVIPATDLTKDSEAATKPNAGNDIVKPADKTAVKDPANLTPEEKKAIEDKVKAVNPGATVVVDDKGNATVTTPEGKTAVIPATDLTKSPEDAAKPNAGNDIVKPADKVVVDPAKGVDEAAKTAIADKVKAVNPGATVVVDDKGNATVTTPEGKTAVIPATDLTKSPEDAAKANAGNAVNTPAAKVEVKDPAKLTDEEKAKVKEAIEAVNSGSKVVVDDKGNATVTTPEGDVVVIPSTDLTKSPEDAAKANAGNAVNTPAAKVEVKDPAKLTDEEKAKVKEAIEAVNPGSKVVVDDKGNATVTTSEGKTATIPAADVTKSAADAGKANAGNAVNTPAAKVEVKDPANLTDAEKKAIEDKVKAVNPGSKVVVDDKGNVTVTTPEGKTATIPAADVTKSAADAGKANAGNGANTPATKTVVKDPAKLTDEEKAKVKKAVEDVNPGSTVVVNDKGDVIVTKGDGTVLVIPELDLVIPEDKLTDPTQQNGVNTPATRVLVGDKAKLTADEIEKVKESIKAVNPGSTVVVDDKGNATVTTPEGKTATIPAAQLVKDAKDVAAKNNGENINVDFEKETVADFNNLTDAEKEAAKAKIKGANADVVEVIFDKAGNATVITKDGKVYTIVGKDIFKQRSSTDNGSSANAGQTTSGQANARKAAKELPNTGTADSTVAMVAAAASALLGLGLAGRRRKDDEEA